MKRCFLKPARVFPLIMVFLFLGLSNIGLGQFEVWSSHYDGGFDRRDEAMALALTPEGDVVLTGISDGMDGTNDIATVKFSGSTGETLWSRRWHEVSGSIDQARAIACDRMGNIFVAGWSGTAPVFSDFITIKYRADGTELWVRRYDNGHADQAMAVVPDEVGGCYVTGYSSNGSNSDYLTIHYLSNGTQEWAVRYNGTANGDDVATGLVWDLAGNLYVTGYSWGGEASQLDYLTLRYNADGELLWTQRYDGTATESEIKSDYAFAIALDDLGNVYVTGRAGESGNWYDATTIKYTPAGQRVWVNRFDWGENAPDGAGEIQVGPDRSVYCAGFTEQFMGYLNMLIYKLTPGGAVEWAWTYDCVGLDAEDSATALSVDRFGNVYVTGISERADGYFDWLTFKYNRNGALVWQAQHGVVEDDDEANAIAVNWRGDVFVAGYDNFEGNEDYVLVKYSAPDVGAALIVQPRDTFRLDATVTPRVMVKNYSALSLTFPVRLEIGNFYFDIQQVPFLAPYDSAVVIFSPWLVRDLGEHRVRCYTMLNGDKEPDNDTVRGVVLAVSAWEQLSEMPPGPKGKAVKDGGALAFASESLVFAFKGNNTTEFYCFNIKDQTWTEKESIPGIGASGSKKRVKGGASLAADADGKIYALKGNNTLEFWRYSIISNQWQQMKDFPAGDKRVKAGAGMVYVPGGNRLYALRGGNTADFYAYSIDGDSWTKLQSVPLGTRNRRVKDGSAVAFDGDSTIYLLKGNTYEFWAYRLSADTWIKLPEISDSKINPKRRKMKKGASLVYDPDFVRVYATKGGKQTEFWYFDVLGNNWVETTDTLPRAPSNRGPYGGAAMVYGKGKIYALKGNKTREFWRYNANLPLNPPGYGTQATVRDFLPRVKLTVTPNPVINRMMVHYHLAKTARVRLVVYDISGRVQRELDNGYQSAGEHSLGLDVRGLSAGVYIIRLEVGDSVGRSDATQKILVLK
ncbi:MAG: SBBP repeat-containing protein [bacterium]